MDSDCHVYATIGRLMAWIKALEAEVTNLRHEVLTLEAMVGELREREAADASADAEAKGDADADWWKSGPPAEGDDA